MSTAANRSSALAQTPSRSFHGEAVATPDSTSGRAAHWGEVKSREEYEVARSKLTDRNFNIRDYPDPLLPRASPAERFQPHGLDPATEKYLLEFITQVKSSQKP